MFLQHIKDATPQADGQSDLRHLFAYDPGRSQYLLQFTQAVMRSPGPLSPGERELLAALTSKMTGTKPTVATRCTASRRR